MDKRTPLSLNPLFATLLPAQLDELAGLAVQKSYAGGHSLFEEGQPCEGLFVIAQGRVKLVTTVPSGRQMVLALETAPNSVAEVPVFDGGPYPASVVAIEDTAIILIP